MKNLTLAIFALLLSTTLFSQKPPEKFGKIKKTDLEATICPIDSSAHAYFLFDFGKASFNYKDKIIRDNDQTHTGFQLIFTRHFRIKILDNQGFDHANVEIPIYDGMEEERLSEIKAYTYNLEENKINKVKLDKDDIYYEQSSENWRTAKFTMPSVRPGSIIEVTYTIISDYIFNLQSWNFQHLIPNLNSEYHVSIPEYYHYNKTLKGYCRINHEHEKVLDRVRLTIDNSGIGQNRSANSYEYTLEFWNEINTYSGLNIPAFPIEPYLKTEKNYLSRIEFELEMYTSPSNMVSEFSTTWDKVKNKLLLADNFYAKLAYDNHLKESEDFLKQNFVSDTSELILASLNQIRSKIRWNGINSLRTTGSLSKSFKEGEGNCSDINLNLVALIRRLGLEAYPVVLSTQKHGIIYPIHPSISGFNYTIALVYIGDSYILLDATSSASNINLLPERCLNGNGLIVSEGKVNWVTLTDIQSYDEMNLFNAILDEDLSVNFNQTLKFSKYAAMNIKKEIYEKGDSDKYILDKFSDYKLDSFNIDGYNNISNSITINTYGKQLNFLNFGGDTYYFTPLNNNFITENPFKLEERSYPVEFNYPYRFQQIYNYDLPDGFIVESVPSPVVYNSPDKNFSYRFISSLNGNRIQISVMLSIKKSTFLPSEYASLKNFFDLIIQKQNELIILKKEK